MPHVIVKLWPGRTEEQKQGLADAIVRDLTSVLGSGEASVSVAIEEVTEQEWKAKVYDPEIEAKADTLYKRPGYRM
jgi:4-oxalocrotonate tautomerase